MSKKGERKEALMRVIVAIVSGIILNVWRYLIIVFAIINFFYSLFAGKRLKRFAELSEIWNSQFYDYMQYLTFVTNKRPFPFNDLRKNLTKFR